MQWIIDGYWSATAVALAFAALLSLQTWEHRRFARSRIARPKRIGPQGNIALIVACKGSDGELESNLRPLFEQTHADYQLIFVTESSEDAAWPVIRRLISQYSRVRSQLVIAGVSSTSGQKVHNLLAATRHLSQDVRYLAFCDADVRPARDWLFLLTQRLDDFDAASGYRYFVPARPTLANCLLSSLNGAVAALMFPGVHHKVWGGSWAIRRSTFDSIGLRDAWCGTLSDDLVASRLLAHTQRAVALEPACIVSSPLDTDFADLWDFVRRQFTIGRVYAPTLWAVALGLNCLGQLVLWSSVAAAAYGLAGKANWAWQPAATAGLLYALYVFRGFVRQWATRSYLPNCRDELAAVRQFDLWLGPLASLACAVGLLGSAVGRAIVWKGIAYEMGPAGQVRRISRPRERAPAPRLPVEINSAARPHAVA